MIFLLFLVVFDCAGWYRLIWELIFLDFWPPYVMFEILKFEFDGVVKFTMTIHMVDDALKTRTQINGLKTQAPIDSSNPANQHGSSWWFAMAMNQKSWFKSTQSRIHLLFVFNTNFKSSPNIENFWNYPCIKRGSWYFKKFTTKFNTLAHSLLSWKHHAWDVQILGSTRNFVFMSYGKKKCDW